MFGATKRLWGEKPFKSHYQVVIIGGGIHGLAAAYFLAKEHGLTDVAVLERRYVGYGGSGRNTAIVRANQRSQANVRLYNEGLNLWWRLMDELDFNMMFWNSGNLNLAHSEAAMGALRLQVSTAQFCGVKSELLDRQQCKELIPALDITDRLTYPIHGGMYHPPGGTLRHDAVAWGLAKGAAQAGAAIHQLTEVTDLVLERGRVAKVRTNRGDIGAERVLVAAGGYSVQLAGMLGIKLPIHPLTIQAMVTQPLKPFLHHVVSSGAYHSYANQTLKGEVATGAHMDAEPNFTTNPTAIYFKHQAEAMTEMLPCLKGVKFMRIWAGLADMTSDMAPIMEGNWPVEGLYLDCGWGYFGFKSGPIAGKYMAEYVARQTCPDVLRPFTVQRFYQGRPMGETAAAINYGPWN
ncbi:MAG: FAD-dependent oxidoreductase [Deltaproteobacteria bacterium]|nr:FAD-dependent oxidoreductase [Deltaproteobacteria bacterium]